MQFRFTFARSLCFVVPTFALSLGALAGCVEVPDNIRAQFAAPSPAERTNYRPGQHGSARPRVEPGTATAANEADGGPAATTTTTSASSAPNAAFPPDDANAKDGGAP